MDAILQLPATLPPHDAAPHALVPHTIVAEWPAGTFVENLVVLPCGEVIVSVMSEARLDRISPQGDVSPVRQFERPPTGLALLGDALYVAVGEPGREAPVLWRLDPATGAGDPWMPLDDMIFANGVTNFGSGALLIADSWQGRLVRVDIAEKRASTWIQHDALTRAPGIDFLPGANGVKRFGSEVTVSSNGRAELYRVAVESDGSSGALRRLAERVRVDDMAYDSAGRLYVATHIGHSIDRIDRDGTRVSVAGLEQGLAGSTACAFGNDGSLYVTTTGGIVMPPGGVLQPAKLARLAVGAQRHPLETAWETRNAPRLA